MRDSARRASVFSFQLIILTGLMASGCGGESSDAMLASPGPQLNAPARTVEEPSATDESVEALAARTERDIDFLLAQQKNGQSMGDAAPDAEPEEQTQVTAAAQPPANAPPKVVIWNDAPQRLPGAPAQPPPPEGHEPAGTKVGTPTDGPPPAFPASAQGNLFRDPPRPVEVRAMDAPGSGATDPGLTTDRVSVLLVDLRRELNLRKSWSDQPVREVLGMAILSIIDPDLTVNPEAFRSDLTESERELVSKFQDFCTALGRDLNDETFAEEALVSAVAELQAALVEEPELDLPASAMCWRVGGFGDFDEFGRYVFLAHTVQQFILYTEVDRFTSELNKKQQWVTEVSLQFEIISDRDGVPVWSEPWQKYVDVTSKQRRDFFIAQIVTLPEALPLGQYYFKIRARDEKSGAEAEITLPFEMVADPKLAVRIPAK